ncbi:MAG: NADP-dependent isocitrate dehydrogenase [Syntrophorhabdaceae bacterium]|nr:NADP-dependent isocitrate dehydrogenase [Syntrophorhabdaceae bacterium]MDD5244477.1 NADP-dependent isocitrate dehydrogenase [Syntrophorhabdaceae bacterium]
MKEKITIPYIAGDGTGEDIWNASHEIFEEALHRAANGEKNIEWVELLAGQKALDTTKKLLPEETVEAIREYKVAIKGPLTTPVGGGFRSINVYLRQIFDLYVCMRPVRYFNGLPSPMKTPEKVGFIIFRENTEDLYRGIEWKEGTPEAQSLIRFLKDTMKTDLPDSTGLGIKPISRAGTIRFTKWVIDYAIKNKRRSITVVHKGNIMKYTEGAFKEYAYEVAREFPGEITFDAEKGKIVFNDRIADNMFMQVILRPDEYDILLCPNLNGDYLSDACAALIGGLGVAPGANIGDRIAIFEPTHGSAPKYAGKDVINPTSFILSGAMLFRYIGLDGVSTLIEKAVEKTIGDGIVTYDLARQLTNVNPVKCSEFGKQVVKRL